MDSTTIWSPAPPPTIAKARGRLPGTVSLAVLQPVNNKSAGKLQTALSSAEEEARQTGILWAGGCSYCDSSAFGLELGTELGTDLGAPERISEGGSGAETPLP